MDAKQTKTLVFVTAGLIAASSFFALVQAQQVEHLERKYYSSQSELKDLEFQLSEQTLQLKLGEAQYQQLLEKEKNAEESLKKAKENLQKEEKRLSEHKEKLVVQINDSQQEIQRQRDIVRVRRESSQQNVDQQRIQQISNAYANHQKLARQLAQAAGKKIVDTQYMGGSNISTVMRSYEFDPSDNTYEIAMAISWNGFWTGGGNFAVDGYIEVGADGSNLSWHPQWLNTELKESQGTLKTLGTVVGSAIVLGSLYLGG